MMDVASRTESAKDLWRDLNSQVSSPNMRLLANGEWVFPSRAGTSLNPGNVLERYVRPVVQGLRIKIDGWRDFRHMLATRSLKKWPTKVVSEILGHSDVRTTLRVTSTLRPKIFGLH
jgi:integrase